jgi:anti-sigma regulatory factor (Ser/Thr protein kinase)
LARDATVRLRAGGHFVHFYERDTDLSVRVVEHVRRALTDGEVAIIIASPEHRALFTAGLSRAEVDVAAARAVGSLIELDAADTLAQVSGEGVLDVTRFDQVLAALIHAVAARGRRVFVYGEMVALLWEAGEVGRALELEGLWNEFREHVPLTLFCAYPNWLSESEESASAFGDVCAAHSRVLSAAPGSDSADATRRFPRSPAAPAEARRFVSEWLVARGHADVVDTAQLTVSELAANAVTHARSDFTVSLGRSPDAIRIIVGDSSTDLPKRRQVSGFAPHGRGLYIVEAITSAMGHELVDGGKLVWADVAVSH